MFFTTSAKALTACKWILSACLVGCSLSPLTAVEQPRAKMQALYGACHPNDIARHAALYWLYPETPEGKQAFSDLAKQMHLTPAACMDLMSESVITMVLSFSTPYSPWPTPTLSKMDCARIRAASRQLAHRQKWGLHVQTPSQVCELPSEEISLARGVLLSTGEPGPELLDQIERYEAQLDLMALYVLAQLKEEATPREKMRALQRFIFETMRVTFPPHSRYEREIARYTHLPGIMEERKGVCLGVSVLYGALAERLGIPVTFITPPGHIFVRYQDAQGERNIETTLRGIHIDSKEYASIGQRQLPVRTAKEVIGMVHMNQAAGCFQSRNYKEALTLYEKALNYLPNDPALAEFTGYVLFALDRRQEARELWQKARKMDDPYSVGENYLLRDLEKGNAGVECIMALLEPCEESYKAREKKLKQVTTLLARYPKWYTGQLAKAQLLIAQHRKALAITCLDACVTQEPQDLQAALLSTLLSLDRYDYLSAWKHLHRLEKGLKELSHTFEEVDDLRRQLLQVCAEPGI